MDESNRSFADFHVDKWRDFQQKYFEYCHRMISEGNWSSSEMLQSGICLEYLRSDEPVFCGDSLAHIQAAIRKRYGYASLSVCLFGLLSNLANMVILMQKQMRSPTSTILSALAVADFLVLLEYIPYSLHEYLLFDRGKVEKHSYTWAMFVLFHAIFGQTFHTISIYMTVALAIWRFLYIRFHPKNLSWFTKKKACRAIACVYCLSPILCLPVYLSLHIEEVHDLRGFRVSGISEDGIIKIIHFWIYGILVKLFPCVLLSVLVFFLVRTVCSSRNRRENLYVHCNRESAFQFRKSTIRKKVADRTNALLLALLLMFLVTEVPQGILSLLSAFYDETFYVECVRPFDEVLDILALINSAVNFIFYCLMNCQYRKTLRQMLSSSRWKCL